MSHATATVQRVRVHACPSIKDHPVQTTTSTKSTDAQTTPGKIAHQAQQCYKEQQQRNAYWNKGGTIEHCPTADINDSACLSLLFSHSEEGSSQVLRYIGQTGRCLNNRTREHAESLKWTPPMDISSISRFTITFHLWGGIAIKWYKYGKKTFNKRLVQLLVRRCIVNLCVKVDGWNPLRRHQGCAKTRAQIRFCKRSVSGKRTLAQHQDSLR